MANYFSRESNTAHEVAAASITAGTFAFTASGLAKFYAVNGADGQAIASGDVCHPYVSGVVVKFAKETTTDVYAIGDPVFGDESTQTAIPSTGTYDGILGYAAEASASGAEYVEVVLNGAPAMYESTATGNLANQAHAINTVGKYEGKMVFNTTTNAPVWAVGSGNTDVWVDATGSTAHTPTAI